MFLYYVQFVAIFACIAYVSGSPIVATPYGLAAPVAAVKSIDYDPNPHYSYTYSVNDALTGDSKSQSESRHGDVVNGEYSFVEADGSFRRVVYNADPVNGKIINRITVQIPSHMFKFLLFRIQCRRPQNSCCCPGCQSYCSSRKGLSPSLPYSSIRQSSCSSLSILRLN